MKKKEAKKLTKGEILKNLDKLKKICLILGFKKLMGKLKVQQKLTKQENQ